MMKGDEYMDHRASTAVIRGLVDKLQKVKDNESDCRDHVIPLLHKLYYEVLQADHIPASLLAEVCDGFSRCLFDPEPTSCVAVRYLRSLRTELRTPGALYKRRLIAEQSLHCPLQERVFVFADPVVVWGPLGASVKAKLELGGCPRRGLQALQTRLLLHTLQTGLGTACQLPALRAALEVPGRDLLPFFQQIVEAVDQSTERLEEGQYHHSLLLIQQHILNSHQNQPHVHLDNTRDLPDTGLPYPDIYFHLWNQEDDFWNVLAKLALTIPSDKKREEQERRGSVQSFDSGIQKDSADLERRESGKGMEEREEKEKKGNMVEEKEEKKENIVEKKEERVEETEEREEKKENMVEEKEEKKENIVEEKEESMVEEKEERVEETEEGEDKKENMVEEKEERVKKREEREEEKENMVEETEEWPVFVRTRCISRGRGSRAQMSLVRSSMNEEGGVSMPQQNNRPTVKVVVMGDDRVLGRLATAYLNIRKRESRCIMWTSKMDLQLFYIPLSNELSSTSCSGWTSGLGGRLSLASFLGREDTYYHDTIYNLGAELSCTSSKWSYHSLSPHPNCFLLDGLSYYLRCAVQPVHLPLYFVKMSLSGGRSVEEVFVSHLQLEFPELKQQTQSATQHRRMSEVISGVAVLVQYQKVFLSKREVAKSVTCSIGNMEISTLPPSVPEGLTLNAWWLGNRHCMEIRSPVFSIRTLHERNFCISLDRDPRRMFSNVCSLSISPCADPAYSFQSRPRTRTRTADGMDKSYMRKNLFLPINTFSGVSY